MLSLLVFVVVLCVPVLLLVLFFEVVTVTVLLWVVYTGLFMCCVSGVVVVA